MKLRHVAGYALAALLLAGCSQPQELMLQRLAPDAPAARGLAPVPVGESPTPLLDQPPFGLYANYPSRDTLERLSTAAESPSGRYRAAFTEQGLWVARVDGAWLWQVPTPDALAAAMKPGVPGAPAPGLPAAPGADPTKPAANQPAAGQAAGTTSDKNKPVPPPQPKGTKYLGPLDWTPKDTLLIRDETGTWVEIDPVTTKVTSLPATLQGKQWLTFSPDSKQVMYYVPGKTGQQLWIAAADGSNPKFQGENVTGTWDPAGKPLIQKVQEPTPGSAGARPGTPAGDLSRGLHSQ